MMTTRVPTSLGLVAVSLCLCAFGVAAWAQDAQPAGGADAGAPADAGTEQPIMQPPLFSRWFPQTRWDEAYAVERSAGYDKLKLGEAIEAWRMFLNLYPDAGMANEAACALQNP